MGTRSLTTVEENRKELLCMYRQFDGYPSGHGDELVVFLKSLAVVNGMGCLAAQVVAHFKTEAGGFYLHASGERDLGEEYIYTVYEQNNVLRLRCQAGAVTFFGLPGTKQGDMPVLFDGPVTEWNSGAVEKEMEKVSR